jgi:hypothetical protein
LFSFSREKENRKTKTQHHKKSHRRGGVVWHFLQQQNKKKKQWGDAVGKRMAKCVHAKGQREAQGGVAKLMGKKKPTNCGVIR